MVFLGFSGGSDGKESACNVGDLGLIPGLGRSPGGGHGNPFEYSWASLVAQSVKNGYIAQGGVGGKPCPSPQPLPSHGEAPAIEPLEGEKSSTVGSQNETLYFTKVFPSGIFLRRASRHKSQGQRQKKKSNCV